MDYSFTFNLVRNIMDFIHDRKSNILFSLYGSKVNRIRIHNKTLTLTVDEMYQLVDGEERTFSGEISFKDCDVDLCKVLIFNKTLGEGRFNGKFICLRDFMNEYVDSEFEIITEGYFANTTTYTGWLWIDEKPPVSVIMYIWNSGDMVYRVKK